MAPSRGILNRLIHKAYPQPKELHGENDERARYNDSISGVRKAEYPMLDGTSIL